MSREQFTYQQTKSPSAQLGAAQRDFLHVNGQGTPVAIPTALSLFEWYQWFAGEEEVGCLIQKKVHKNPLCKNKEGSLYVIYKKGKNNAIFFNIKKKTVSECVDQIFLHFKNSSLNFTYILKKTV